MTAIKCCVTAYGDYDAIGPLVLAIAAVIRGRPQPDGHLRDGPPSWRPWIPLANLIDHRLGWHRLPWPLGLPIVVTFLRQLRRDNLHDPSTITASRPRSLHQRLVGGEKAELAVELVGIRGA